MLRLLSFALILISIKAFALSMDERKQKILRVIDEELSETTRLSKQKGNRDPDLLLRISELHLEKARLFREAENDKYLSVSVEERQRSDKKAFFRDSEEEFVRANKYGQAVIKNFPRYKSIGDVYYILAYNTKEIGQHQASEKFFALATKNAQKGTPTFYKSQLALADAYYNKHKYEDAIPLYESALKHLNETWWTKDAFNLAWSYYRVKNYDRAIRLMQEVHKKSGDSQYISMRSYVERDIGIFFVDAKKIPEGVQYYKSLGIDFSSHLVKIAKATMEQGKFTQAESLLDEAISMQKTPESRAEILFMQMSLYDKYGKIPEHYKTAKELADYKKKGNLDEDKIKGLDYQIAKKAAELQKAATSELYKNAPEVRKTKGNLANQYFALLNDIRGKESAEVVFFQGETSYAVGEYGKSLEYYLKSYDLASAEKNDKVRKQSLEAMLASLGQSDMPKATAEKYYLKVYNLYLQTDNKSERAQLIYQKIYKIQIERKDYAGAESTLRAYTKAFPNDQKTQEAMLAGVMEEYRKLKQYDKIKAFVAEINDGNFKVSKKYADNLRSLMTKLQIEDAQSSLDKGDKSRALNAYLKIYNNTESTEKAKANAAYNLSALYYELGSPSDSYVWATKALKEMTTADIKSFSESLLTISTYLFLKQRFLQSADLNQRLLAKLCHEDSSHKKTCYKNGVYLWLSDGKLDEAQKMVELGGNCGIDENLLNETRLELAKEFKTQKRWESLEQMLAPLKKSPRFAPQTIPYLETLKGVYAELGERDRAAQAEQEVLAIYQSAKAKNQEIPVEGLDIIANYMLQKLKAKNEKMKSMTLQFPEDNFNKTVKAKLAVIDSLAGDLNAVKQTGSGRGIVKGYFILVDTYRYFGNELKNFTPEGKSEQYLDSFRKAMSSVYTPVLNQAQKLSNEIKTVINQNKILGQENFDLVQSDVGGVRPRYHFTNSMILMDRGGRQ